VRVAGAVLSGGASSRMGTDKALVVVDGAPMGATAASTLRLAGCDPVVFVGGDPGELEGLGADVVADLAPGEGPLGGVMTALERFVDVADHVVIVSCDMPFLTAADLRPLVARARTAGVDVVVGRASRLQPLCAVWSTAAAGRVRAAFERGARSMHGVLDELDTEDVRVSMQAVRNINTQDDLDQ
jgi:molybdopterin-guanine dinucleotide biosynthesis protein A